MKSVKINKTEKKRLDKANTERVETTKVRVAHAMKLLQANDTAIENEDMDKFDLKPYAKAGCLLDAAHEEMNWACKHFEWNDDVCIEMEKAIKAIGYALAEVAHPTWSDEHDTVSVHNAILETVDFYIDNAKVILAKVLATLCIWFEDDVKVEDV